MNEWLSAPIPSLPLGVPPAQLTGHTLLAAAMVTWEPDEICIPVDKRSVQERARWQGASTQQQLPVAVCRVPRLPLQAWGALFKPLLLPQGEGCFNECRTMWLNICSFVEDSDNGPNVYLKPHIVELSVLPRNP